MATKKQSNATTAAEVGAGLLAAAAAAGAGYYFYGSKDAKKHRAGASKWAQGMKADVVKEARKVKKLDQKAIAAIVDKAAAAYTTVRSVNPGDLKAASAELKKNWRLVSQEIGGVKKRAAGAVKSVKKSSKKSVKKVAPKKAAQKKAAKKTPKKAAGSSKKSAKKSSR